MAVDKLVDSSQLDADLTSVANAIRTKGGTSASLAFPAEFISAIQAISGGGSGKTVVHGSFTPTEKTNPNNYWIELGQACTDFYLYAPGQLYGSTNNPNNVRTLRRAYYFPSYGASSWECSGTNSGNSAYATSGTGNTTNRVQFSGTQAKVACRVDTNGGGYYRDGVTYYWFAF